VEPSEVDPMADLLQHKVIQDDTGGLGFGGIG
jgi:hypothetical protein